MEVGPGTRKPKLLKSLKHQLRAPLRAALAVLNRCSGTSQEKECTILWRSRVIMRPQAVRRFDQTALPVFKIHYTRPLEPGLEAPESLELQMSPDFAKWATEPLSTETAFENMDPLAILYSDQGGETLWAQSWNAEIGEVAAFYRSNSERHRREGTKDQAALADRKYPSPIEIAIRVVDAEDIAFDWEEYKSKFEPQPPRTTLGLPPLDKPGAERDKLLLYDCFAIEEEDRAKTLEELIQNLDHDAEASFGASSSTQGPPPKATSGYRTASTKIASPSPSSRAKPPVWVPTLYPRRG